MIKKTFGLMGMRERALALGGDLKIHSAPGQGTQIAVRVPVNRHTPRGAA
jgi:signal transduction histidine kinase